MMADNGDHLMAKSKGPAKQFVALVGDKNGSIRQMLEEKLTSLGGDIFYIETYYYSAKFAIKTFESLTGVVSEYSSDKSQMACLFVAFKSLENLKEAKMVADGINADTRVIIVESLESCPEAEEVELFASGNQFEVVYLKPNEEQIIDAKELSEKVGIDRLIETMEVCNWPWRTCNASARLQGMVSTFMSNNSTEVIEHEIGPDDVFDGAAAEMFMLNYKDWCDRNPEALMPAPQHAERVHLSPDSPTTTEGTTNPDDVSISVDIDLVCTKSNDENESQRCGDNNGIDL